MREFVFDPAAWPCTVGVPAWKSQTYVTSLRRGSSYLDEEAVEELIAQLALIPDADTAHRMVLAARRAGVSSVTKQALSKFLEPVRPHSTLYGQRSCECLRAAWVTYTHEVQRALLDVGTAGQTFAVTVDGRAHVDRHAPLMASDVFTPHRAPRDPVTTRVDVEGQVVHIRCGKAQTFVTGLDEVRARLSYLALPGYPMHGGAAIARWPDALVTCLDELVRARRVTRSGFDRDLAADVARLLAPLSADQLAAAADLASGWTGSVEELHTAVVAVTAT